MRIQILLASQKHPGRSNKDTNGGYGTVNDFGNGFAAFFLKSLKNRTMNFPELLPAYVISILKSQGHSVSFSVNKIEPCIDIVLILTSIIDFKKELQLAQLCRDSNPNVKIGFFGGMSSGNPDLYLKYGDFVVTGEIENALINQDLAGFRGKVEGGYVDDLDQLPFPDWGHIQQWQPRYGFIQKRSGRLAPIQSSRGCPMSCGYYCTYPLVQGNRFRERSPQNVVEEIKYLQEKYAISTLIFRDPIFSLKMERVEEICNLLIANHIKIDWLCETHPRFLNEKLIRLMKKAGCISVKLGIESGNPEVMKKSHRSSCNLDFQQSIIQALELNGISVISFYILGYFDDDAQSIQQTLDYACLLNTLGAQFTIATPYPGTPWYAYLENNHYSLDPDFENYTQYDLVYQHPKLSRKELARWKNIAYQKYYFRWNYFKKHYKNLFKL